MDYAKRINKVIDYIGQHIDEELDLDQLSQVACFSKFHFHRLFTAHTGLSLQQTIRWLRLKRAGHQLVAQQDSSIVDIAMNAGFLTHESFSRAFKQLCGVSPSEFRKAMNWSALERPPYSLPKSGENMTEVKVKQMDARRLAVVEHRGDPQRLGESVSKLISWAKAQPINVKPSPGDAFGFAYDDPKQVAPSEFRMDLGLTVPAQLSLSGVVCERILPAGRYAVAVHKGSRDLIGETVYPMYRDWLPQSGEEPGNLPCLFCYHNFDHEVADTELITEVWIYLK